MNDKTLTKKSAMSVEQTIALWKNSETQKHIPVETMREMYFRHARLLGMIGWSEKA